MVPAAGLLLVFLTYPLGLGTWLGFTDAKIVDQAGGSRCQDERNLVARP